MKQRALGITVAFFAMVSVAAGAVALTDEGSRSGEGTLLARDADSGGESSGDGNGSAADCATAPCEDVGGGAAGICLEGTVDCNDTPVEKPGDGVSCTDINPPPPGCWAPDAPVSNEPPVIDEPPPPDCPEPSVPCVVDVCTMEYPNECIGTKAAVADLMARLDLEADAITVLSAERVDWPDSCLGIDKRDIACAEVITPGFRIILEASGQKYEYHTDGGSRAELAE